MDRASFLTLTILLGLITAIEPLSVDMSLPAMPAVAVELNTEAASVQISLSEPYDRLVPTGTVAVGLYQRFTLPGGGGPPWIVVGLILGALMGLTWWLLRRWRPRGR